MQQKLESVLRAHGLFSKDKAILVACSGGADSLVLLDVLAHLRAVGGPRIVCAHMEHGIRGEASRRDAEFVAAFCAANDIPFVCEAADVPAYAREHKLSVETAARICRYEFLSRECGAQGCDCIATAHHADDLAETVLMRILRGTGPAGLAAMSEWNGTRLRPLLTVTRAQIEAYAAARSLTPRSDATNALLDATRNRIRHRLLPLLRSDYNPAADAALIRLSTLAREEDDFLSACAERALARVLSVQGLSQAVLQGLHPALQRRVLRLYWQRETGAAQDFSYVHEERMRALIDAHAPMRQDMPHGYMALARYGYIALRPRVHQETILEKEREIFLPIPAEEYAIIDFREITVRLRCISRMECGAHGGAGNADVMLVDAEQAASLVLRTRRRGDYMRLTIGRKKLKKILIDDHVPREQRDAIPLLARSGSSEILWVLGVRRSADASIVQGTGDILQIECVRETIAR